MVIFMPRRVIRVQVVVMQRRREKRMPVIHTRVEQAYVGGFSVREARAGKQVIYPLGLLGGCELAQEKFSVGLDRPDFSNEVEQFDCLFKGRSWAIGCDDYSPRKYQVSGFNFNPDNLSLPSEFCNDICSPPARVAQPYLKPVRFCVARRGPRAHTQ